MFFFKKKIFHFPSKYKKYLLKPGYIFVSCEPTIIFTVLGSCVSVCLWDRKNKFGGMNNFMFPKAKSRSEATPIYGNASVLGLINLMKNMGSEIEDLEAQILGGGDLNDSKIGRENVKVALEILRKKDIPIVSKDIGGKKGRKVIYNTLTNEIIVIKVEKLRKTDWYPYE